MNANAYEYAMVIEHAGYNVPNQRKGETEYDYAFRLMNAAEAIAPSATLQKFAVDRARGACSYEW